MRMFSAPQPWMETDPDHSSLTATSPVSPSGNLLRNSCRRNSEGADAESSPAEEHLMSSALQTPTGEPTGEPTGVRHAASSCSAAAASHLLPCCSVLVLWPRALLQEKMFTGSHCSRQIRAIIRVKLVTLSKPQTTPRLQRLSEETVFSSPAGLGRFFCF